MKISPVHISRLCCCIIVACLVVGGPLRAQEGPRDAASFSFIFLPLRTSQQLEMTGEQFMDEFLKVIRMQGHNAVSTRYLRSILLDSRFGALEACTTSACMKNLVRVVGARFIVHGSLISDSTSGLTVELHVIDVPGEFEVASQVETFNKNPASSGAQVLDFIVKILQSVTTSKGKKTPEPVLLQQIDTAISVQSTIVVQKQSDTLVQNDTMNTTAASVKQLDTVSSGDSANLSINSQVQSQAVEQKELVPSENLVVSNDMIITAGHTIETAVASENRQVDSTVHIPAGTETPEKHVTTNDTLNMGYDDVNITVTEKQIDSNKTDTSEAFIEKSRRTDDITRATLTQSSVPDNADIISQTIGPVAPSEALDRKPKGKTFKKVRIAGFGLCALAGLAGGIITNESVKKSLKEETALFNLYMKADAEHAERTYQKYISQTDKTDAKIRQRSLLYVLGVLGLTACTVSIRF